MKKVRCCSNTPHSLFMGALLLVLSLSAAMADAAESTPQQSPRVTATLISEVDSVVPGQQLRIGLRQRLAPHWHTYWQNPGDAGAPPTITLTLPQGVMAGEIDWPGPDRIPVGPAVSFGYEKEIVLPMKVTVPDDAIQGELFSIQAVADWVVCEKECIPETGTHTEQHWLDLVALAAPYGHIALIDDPDTPIDLMPLKRKSLAVHWEFMFTSSLFKIAEMPKQGLLLNRVAELVDQGLLKSTLTETLHPINAANLKKAHAQLESGRTKGKVVLTGF